VGGSLVLVATPALAVIVLVTLLALRRLGARYLPERFR